ncbi:MAG TPA: hypothetical protein VH120_20365 [Gemmataceae bacterium]|nr:hypothetical protein [Gemmataceae bacterium]
MFIGLTAAAILLVCASATAVPLFGLFSRRAKPLRRVTTRKSLPLADWNVQTVSDLSAAQDLMDMLESCGTTERELIVRGNADFEVRWR